MIAARLGLNEGDDGVFLFDQKGLCKFSSRQQVTTRDIQQLLQLQGFSSSPSGGSLDYDSSAIMKGQLLPSWTVADTASITETTIDKIRKNTSHVWVFFPISCFACGIPSPSQPLTKFRAWQKDNSTIEGAVLIFDSGYRHNEIVDDLKSLNINLPAYVSKEEMAPISRLLASKGYPPNQPVAIFTDPMGLVTNARLIMPGKNRMLPSRIASTYRAGEIKSSYEKILENFDVYDIASHNGLYYVSERSQSRILVLDENFTTVKTIGQIGSSPTDLFRPGYIDVSSDGIICVQDGGNDRIQSYNVNGRHLGAFSPEPYSGFAVGVGGEVYLGQPEKGKLISVYSYDGRYLRSFGELKVFSDLYGANRADKNTLYRNAINRIRLSIDYNGDIIVSFMLAPIIQKYTKLGKLVFERRLKSPEIDALASRVPTGSVGHLTTSRDGVLESYISLEAITLKNGDIAVTLTDGSIYLTNSSGDKLSASSLLRDYKFTPQMIGKTPTGRLILIGMSPRVSYVFDYN